MEIKDYNVKMQSVSQKLEIYKKEETLNYWQNKPMLLPNNKEDSEYNDILEISKESQSELDKLKKVKKNTDNDNKFKLSAEEQRKIKLIESFIEFMTGKKTKIKVYMGDSDYQDQESDGSIKIVKVNSDINKNIDSRKGWGLNYSLNEEYYQKETMAFRSTGLVKTSDGREISFNLHVNMAREFYQQKSINIKAGDALVDPLVVNFSSNTPKLTEEKFYFDIDNDGKNDQISSLDARSGFLAIDKNNDGNINNGSELFGPATGNGFQELEMHDSDGNNWIDENDEVFDKLRIWVKDKEGNNKLFALGEKGIGAIYVGNINTPFDLNDEKNQMNGIIRKTGIYLKENGEAGTIQHIDFVV